MNKRMQNQNNIILRWSELKTEKINKNILWIL